MWKDTKMWRLELYINIKTLWAERRTSPDQRKSIILWADREVTVAPHQSLSESEIQRRQSAEGERETDSLIRFMKVFHLQPGSASIKRVSAGGLFLDRTAAPRLVGGPSS